MSTAGTQTPPARLSNVSLPERAYRIRRNALRMGEVQGQGYIAQALDKVEAAQVLSESEVIALFAARGRDVSAVCAAADQLRGDARFQFVFIGDGAQRGALDRPPPKPRPRPAAHGHRLMRLRSATNRPPVSAER